MKNKTVKLNPYRHMVGKIYRNDRTEVEAEVTGAIKHGPKADILLSNYRHEWFITLRTTDGQYNHLNETQGQPFTIFKANWKLVKK